MLAERRLKQMNKSMYSLMLMDDVVNEIDKIALRMNTNRSNLVNQILAEYASMMTPEKRINDIFKYVESLLSTTTTDIIPFVMPNQHTMSMKSSLQYKYRPTIKYEVELYRSPDGAIGELTVSFRTQSQTLLNAIASFFRLWKRLEDAYISELYDAPIRYELYDGKFVRSISVPRNRNYTNEQLGDAISSYIQMLDKLMKGYISGAYSTEKLENDYRSFLNNGVGLI